jgi:hypothetical protein
MEQFVRSIQSHDVTREARRNVVRMVETSLLNNRGEMVGIEKEVKANLLARFSAESNAQEDKWRAAYFNRLMERLKGGHTDARLVPGETASQFVRDVAGAINAEVVTFCLAMPGKANTQRTLPGRLCWIWTFVT